MEQATSQKLTYCFIAYESCREVTLSVMAKLGYAIHHDFHDEFIDEVMKYDDMSEEEAINLLGIIAPKEVLQESKIQGMISLSVRLLERWSLSYRVQKKASSLLALWSGSFSTDNTVKLYELIFDKVSRPDLFEGLYEEGQLIQMARAGDEDNHHKIMLMTDEYDHSRVAKVIPSMCGPLNEYHDKIVGLIGEVEGDDLVDLLYLTNRLGQSNSVVNEVEKVMRRSRNNAYVHCIALKSLAFSGCVSILREEFFQAVREENSELIKNILSMAVNFLDEEQVKMFLASGMIEKLILLTKESQRKAISSLYILHRGQAELSSEQTSELMKLFTSSDNEDIKRLVVSCLANSVDSQFAASTLSMIAYTAGPRLFESCIDALKSLKNKGVNIYQYVYDNIISYEFTNAYKFPGLVMELIDGLDQYPSVIETYKELVMDGSKVEFGAALLTKLVPEECDEIFHSIQTDDKVEFLRGMAHVNNISQCLEYFAVYVAGKYAATGVQVLKNLERLSPITIMSLNNILMQSELGSPEWMMSCEVYKEFKHMDIMRCLSRLQDMSEECAKFYLECLDEVI